MFYVSVSKLFRWQSNKNDCKKNMSRAALNGISVSSILVPLLSVLYQLFSISVTSKWLPSDVHWLQQLGFQLPTESRKGNIHFSFLSNSLKFTYIQLFLWPEPLSMSLTTNIWTHITTTCYVLCESIKNNKNHKIFKCFKLEDLIQTYATKLKDKRT